MTSMFAKKTALVAAVLLAGGAGATAQQMRVAVSKVESGDWHWVAIYSGVAATPYVESVVALRDPATATGDNLRVVQYTRGATWTSQAWTTPDPWEAINWIKDDLGLTDNEDNEWGICNDAGVEESVAPVGYTDGMLTADPWTPLVLSLPDPATYIETLVDLGYPAADLAVDNDAQCSSDAVLNGLAADFESMIATGDITILSVGEGGVNCEFFGVGAGVPNAPKGPKPAPTLPKPIIAPGWTPSGPPVPGPPPSIGPNPWTPGGWPAGWRCHTTYAGGGQTYCFCSRIQIWGRWETRTCGCWPITYPCIRWHLVYEYEHCSSLGACPAGGGPGPSPACGSKTFY